jgi:hypothetical protein
LTPSQLSACGPTTILAEFLRMQQLPDSISGLPLAGHCDQNTIPV